MDMDDIPEGWKAEMPRNKTEPATWLVRLALRTLQNQTCLKQSF